MQSLTSSSVNLGIATAIDLDILLKFCSQLLTLDGLACAGEDSDENSEDDEAFTEADANAAEAAESSEDSEADQEYNEDASSSEDEVRSASAMSMFLVLKPQWFERCMLC